MKIFSDSWNNPNSPYYLVDDKKYYSAFEARCAIKETGTKNYRYVFLEHAYDKLDWTKEPVESWDYLCRQRALQIRQKYKKLKLLWSGGSDSGHVWRVFEQNNIPIDELVMLYTDWHPLRAIEYRDFMLPLALEMVKRHPHMKIREIKLDESQFNYLMGSDNFFEGPESRITNTAYLPHHFAHGLVTQDPDGDNLNTGYILGLEKPHLMIRGGSFIFVNHDIEGKWWIYNMPNLEYFYWAPDLPELFLKQCWLQVNYIEQHYPDADAEFLKKFQDAKGLHYSEFCDATGRGNIICQPLGDGKNKSYDNYHWSIQKTISYGNDNDLKSFHNWNYAMQVLKKENSDMFIDGDPHKGFLPIFGKQYFIKIQNKKIIK